MNEQNMRFRVGVFVLAAMILLAVLIILFSGFPTLFRTHTTYTVVFPAAPGVGAGTPILRSGVRIGEVRSLALDDETGQVRVKVLIEKPHSVHKDDRAVLVRGLLGGDPAIEFRPRAGEGEVADRSTLEPGTEVAGVLGPDALSFLKSLERVENLGPQTEDAIKEIKELAKTTREAIPEFQVAARNWSRVGERVDVLLQTNQEKLVQALDNFSDTVSRVSRVFNDENQKNLAATLKNVRASSETLDSLTKNTNEVMKESRETIHRVNDSVNRADDVLNNLQKATKPLAERSDSIVKNLDESTARLNRVLAETNDLLRAMNQGDGSFRRFVSDPAFYNNLNDAASMFVHILPRLDRIMKDIEVFSDKIARHPESLGVGGAVKPSSGLKEGPSRWRGP